MKAYDKLGLLIEMYVTASYEGFGSPARTGNEIDGVASMMKGEMSFEQVEVKNQQVYKDMGSLERKLDKLISEYWHKLCTAAERSFSRTCETCGERFVGGEADRYCRRCINERIDDEKQ